MQFLDLNTPCVIKIFALYEEKLDSCFYFCAVVCIVAIFTINEYSRPAARFAVLYIVQKSEKIKIHAYAVASNYRSTIRLDRLS